MEHIVRSLNKAPELTDYIGEGYEDVAEDIDDHESATSNDRDGGLHRQPESRRSLSRASTDDGSKLDTENVTPEMESRFFSSVTGNAKAGSRLSMADIADRHLRDKTDAIAYIIRNISDQCAAAVEGLQLAHDAEDGEQLDPDRASATKPTHQHTQSDGDASMHTDVSQLGANSDNGEEHDSGHGGSTGFLTPNGGRESRTSSIPPTPDLVGGNRSSTSMSGYSNSTGATPERSSHQWQTQQQHETRTKILDIDEVPHDSGSEIGMPHDTGLVDKEQTETRPVTARMVSA